MAIFHGTNGNDNFTGTQDIDTVTFAGNAAGYEVRQTTSGKIQVRDIDFSDGDTGIDTLAKIDLLSFADRTFGMRSDSEIVLGSFPEGSYYFDYTSSSATLADGSYILTWIHTSYDASDGGDDYIYQQRFDVWGNTLGRATVVGHGLGNTAASSVAALGDGYLIAWQDSEGPGSSAGVYAQRYNAAGNKVGSEMHVNTTTVGYQGAPVVATLDGGGYVISWSSFPQGGGDDGAYAQRYNAAGDKVGGETRINTTTVGNQFDARIAALEDGGYVIFWRSNHEEADIYDYNIYAQRYNASGNAVGGETRINNTTGVIQYDPEVAALADGGYLATWTSDATSGSDVYLRRFDEEGDSVGGEVRVNTRTAGLQNENHVAVLEDDGYVVAWASSNGVDGYDVYFQRYDAAGNKVGGERLANTATTDGYQRLPEVTAMADGGFTISWAGDDPETYTPRIYSHRYDAAGQLMTQRVTLTGTGGDDVMNGGFGAQTIRGLDGNDRIDGGGGSDVLFGGLGNDTLIGSRGADAFVFNRDLKNGANVDTINHLLQADKDFIRLDNAVFTKFPVWGDGTLNPGHFVANANGEAQDANDFIVYDNDSGELFYDRDGSGAIAKVKFAVIGNKAALTAADFEIV